MKLLHSIAGKAVSNLTADQKIAIASIKHDFPNYKFRINGQEVQLHSGDTVYGSWELLRPDMVEYWSRPFQKRNAFDPSWIVEYETTS